MILYLIVWKPTCIENKSQELFHEVKDFEIISSLDIKDDNLIST
jgi:hypothetical protein